MSYFAAAVVRGPDGWAGSEVELNGVADIDEVADRLRDIEPDADVSLLFVEADDAYLVILRLDEGEDLRIFGSDSAFAEESRLGALLLGEAEGPPSVPGSPAGWVEPAEVPADGGLGTDEPVGSEPAADTKEPDVEPVGDADLLADLGMPAQRLLVVCGRDGMMPADMT
ncbi:MAG: tRNA adenosine deaminase-associated protein, partial [Micromonosporaceae bacterium]|nr:tRNA adenosine deaminase-associated protein [Micromonosporaceae bacterium]